MATSSGGRRIVRRFLAGVVALALSGACIWAGLQPPDEGVRKKRKMAFPRAVLACATDDDCVLVDRIGCCTCQASGARWAINHDQSDQLRRFLKHSCGTKAPCVQFDACRPDLVAACVDGHCAVRVAPADPEVHDG